MDAFWDFIREHWVAISLLAPACWSVVNIIDVYFVDGIYKDEIDGMIIVGLFQAVIWPILFFTIDFKNLDIIRLHSGGILGIDNALLISFLSGAIYFSAFYFYFKTLFRENDVSILQIFWNLTAIVVPLASFVFFNEILSASKYAGMALVFLGATIISTNAKLRSKLSAKYLSIMSAAVLFLSLSMILQERVYESLNASYGDQGFWLGFLFFSWGVFLSGFLLAIYFKRNPFPLIKKYYKVFLLAEGIYFLGNLFSQWSINSAPSVSYVAVIETFEPVFILVYSLLILFFFSFVLRKKNKVVKRIYSEQITGMAVKIFATVIMATGIYLIS